MNCFTVIMLYASKRCIHRPTWWCVFTKWWRELNVDSCRQFELQLSFNNFYIFDQLFWWYIVNQLYASIRLSILYMRTYFSAIFRRAYGVKLLEQSRSETFFLLHYTSSTAVLQLVGSLLIWCLEREDVITRLVFEEQVWWCITRTPISISLTYIV